MKLLSVNTSQPKLIQNGKKSGLTGIFKTPNSGPVKVGLLGLEHDVQVDTENHGGIEQAVYIYSSNDYDWWAKHLGKPLEPGIFGENLTFSSLPEPLYIKDQFELGTVILEVTWPRIPCSTLSARMQDLAFVEKFVQAERPGVYAKVIQEGSLRAGDSVNYVRGENTTTALEEFHRFYQKNPALKP